MSSLPNNPSGLKPPSAGMPPDHCVYGHGQMHRVCSIHQPPQLECGTCGWQRPPVKAGMGPHD